MNTTIFDQVLQFVTTGIGSIGSVLVNLFSSILGIFWNSSSGITFYGSILFIGLGITLILIGLNWLVSLAGGGVEDAEEEEEE